MYSSFSDQCNRHFQIDMSQIELFIVFESCAHRAVQYCGLIVLVYCFFFVYCFFLFFWCTVIVFVCIYICVYVHVYIHAYTHMCMRVCIHTRIHTYVYACMYTYTHIYIPLGAAASKGNFVPEKLDLKP